MSSREEIGAWVGGEGGGAFDIQSRENREEGNIKNWVGGFNIMKFLGQRHVLQNAPIFPA